MVSYEGSFAGNSAKTRSKGLQHTPCLTNNVGTFTFKTPFQVKTGPASDPALDLTSSLTTSGSLKTNTVKSDFSKATMYSRKCVHSQSFSSVDYVTSVGKQRWIGDDSRYWIQPKLNWFGTMTSANVAVSVNLRNQAIIEAKLKVLDLQANIGEDIAQLGQIHAQIKDIWYAIAYCFFILAAGRRPGDTSQGKLIRSTLRSVGVSLPRHISNWWLAYFYGIRPLISTVQALANHASRDYESKPRKISRLVKYELDSARGVNMFAGHHYHVSGRAEQSSKVVIKYRIRGSGTKLATEIGATNVPALAWALVPYSFVLDWLIPVENWLQSFSAFRGVRIDEFSELLAATNNCRCSLYKIGNDWLEGKIPQVLIQSTFMQRNSLAGLVLTLPYVSQRFTTNQGLSAIALAVTQRLK